MDYVPVHACESKTLEGEPDLGAGDVSQCLPGWIKTFCEQHEAGEGYTMSKSAVAALAHTLIAARARCHRLIRERDAALLHTLPPALIQYGVKLATSEGEVIACLRWRDWTAAAKYGEDEVIAKRAIGFWVFKEPSV